MENYRALASLLGEPRPTDVPHVALDAAWRQEAERLWAGSRHPRVALQPGAAYGPAKRWAAGRFAEVARELGQRGCTVAVVGGTADVAAVRAVREAAPVLDLSGQAPLGVLGALLEAADLVVTNDTGPMHLAAAVGTPTVAIFGSTSRGCGRGRSAIVTGWCSTSCRARRASSGTVGSGTSVWKGSRRRA